MYFFNCVTSDCVSLGCQGAHVAPVLLVGRTGRSGDPLGDHLFFLPEDSNVFFDVQCTLILPQA